MNKEQDAIRKFKLAATIAEREYRKPLQVCYSGGKDSDVLLRIALKSGCNFQVQHSFTSIDAPETIKHIQNVFAQLGERGISCRIIYPIFRGKRINMWTLIPTQGIPPTNMCRYCCKILKEVGGARFAVATGVRKAESTARQKREFANNFSRKYPSNIDFNDFAALYGEDGNVKSFVIHDENFKQSCKVKGKTSFQPLIDWTDEDIFSYIDAEKIKLNPLYSNGFNRVGCIGCPLAGGDLQVKEFKAYPTYAMAFYTAFLKMLVSLDKAEKVHVWKTPTEVFDWWLCQRSRKLRVMPENTHWYDWIGIKKPARTYNSICIKA